MESIISRAEPLAQQVRDYIYEQIINGTFAASETYSVSELSQQLGISRTPVREAILQLEEIGLVTIIRNKGFRAVEVNVEDIISAFQLRYLLEPFSAARVAKQPEHAATAKALEGLMKSMLKSSREADRKGFMKADREFHDLILDKAGNTMLARAVNAARDATYNRGLSTNSAVRTWDKIREEHEEILQAIAAGDSARAAEAMESHICETGKHLVTLMGHSAEGDWLGVEEQL